MYTLGLIFDYLLPGEILEYVQDYVKASISFISLLFFTILNTSYTISQSDSEKQ